MPRRVLVVAHRPDLRGATKSLLELACALNPNRFIVTAVVPGAGPLEDAFRRASIEVSRVPMQYLSYSPSLLVRAVLQFPMSTLHLVRLIRSHRIDLVHVATMVNLHPTLAARVTHTPLVWYLHEMPRRTVWRQCVLEIIRRCATFVLANSHATMREVWPYSDPPSRVVHIGIDPRRFEDPAIPRSVTRRRLGIPDRIGPVIGNVGTLTPLKGQALFLKAAAIVARSEIDAAFVLVGSGPDEMRLKRMCSELGIGDRVWFTGERVDVENLYQIFDVVVSTSKSEGFGRTLVEAMAARRPVIATRAGGTEEIVEDGKTGLLLPPGDPAIVAYAMLRLLRDPRTMTQMGEMGRARVVERFSLANYVREVERVFDHVTLERS